MKRLVVIGAGGFSKTIIDSIDFEQYDLIGYVDEGRGGEHLGKPIFGPDVTYVPEYRDCCYYICFGNNATRKKWYNRVKGMRLELVNIIDQSAFISPSAVIGEGNFIGKNSIVNAYSRVGDNNIINEFTLIAPSVYIGDHCNVAPNVSVSGEVTIGSETFIGTTAAINGQLSIGHNVTIGSGASVINSIEPYCTAVGVPAKIIKRDVPAAHDNDGAIAYTWPEGEV